MSPAVVRNVILLGALAQLVFAKDPLNDFCRRWGHQTTVIDRKLYIDGGQVTWNPMSQNPLNYTNTWLSYQNLDILNQGMPQLEANLSKNSTVPDLSGGVLWGDDVNKVFYLFGGEYVDGASPEDFQPWAYDVLLDQWNQTSSTAASQIQRVSYGAGTTVNQTGIGYYLGGWLNNNTVPSWGELPLATSNLISYNMVEDTWTNATGPDTTGRAEGVMVYIPASDQGLLVYFGGIMDPFKNGTVVGSAMSTIYIYDIASTKWYTQTATGEIPDMRRKFCAGATWAQDQSSYNIYLYGGLGVNNGSSNGSSAFDDVYILSLPSFTWIKWYPTTSGPGSPHGILSCNVIDNSQMLIIGGWFPESQDCDAPTIWGTHNLNLGEDGPQKAMWDLFEPNITEYLVPPEIISVVGGTSTGGATVKSPASWDNRDLPVYFTRIPSYSARAATRSIPTTTSTSTSSSSKKSSTDVGAIAGGAVGGVLGLAAILLLVWFSTENPSPDLSAETRSRLCIHIIPDKPIHRKAHRP
ncbi:hypothetical protein K490DRAFT_74814 [Saccharata proteae CBS 121410]|uniref:Attractin/MKLN-like beta-propeller domain-containing protein n=1 Tax=Saccharata proteae CBS 121410 TaxID=1314787 RepID=A0A9P4HVD3_9PEZI|nr:hypothetical protein K490DRAFT_74814 [Saccharata proteae CBS 121410]